MTENLAPNIFKMHIAMHMEVILSTPMGLSPYSEVVRSFNCRYCGKTKADQTHSGLVSRDHFSPCLNMSRYCWSTIPFTLVDGGSPHWPNS